MNLAFKIFIDKVYSTRFVVSPKPKSTITYKKVEP